MKREDFENLGTVPNEAPTLTAESLSDKTPRTLLIGETADCYLFHVYLGQDGYIHILTYQALMGRRDEPRFLVLRHQSQKPGVECILSNDAFVDVMPAWPESCDLEFCQALIRAGVQPKYANFNDDAAAERQRRYEGFAGFTADHPGAIHGEMMHERLRHENQYPQYGHSEYSTLAPRLILQAANDLAVPAAILGWTKAVVADVGKEAVYDLACDYLNSLNRLDVRSESFVRHLVLAAFEQFPLSETGKVTVDYGHVLIELPAGHIPFVDDSDFSYYTRVGDFQGHQGVAGEFEGNPFVAARFSDGRAEIRFMQFGDRERFLELWLAYYRLVSPI